jgi:hypothetical protein
MTAAYLEPSMPGTFPRLMLYLLILWTAMQLGAGLYEKRAVIPLWAENATPATLGQRLEESGHTASSTRFWPFISPVVFLLAIINLVLAWRFHGAARPWWLAAAAGFLIMSVSTYAYFVPTMLSMMHRADTYSQAELARTMSLWLNLSNLRMLIAVPAWLAAIKALTLLGGRPGWTL